MKKNSAITLPSHVCVLDVETEQVEFQNPEGCILAFVGVKTFVLSEGSYQSKEYKCYLADDVTTLEQFLHTFDGLIIGHNIFAFDYRTLRTRLSLDGVLEKTADTLDLLLQKNRQRHTGLKLDHLCRANLGKGKTLDGASTPELWRQGKRDEVIAYNENDCNLTMELWQHLVVKRTGIIRFYKKDIWTDERTFKISSSDLQELLCQKPRHTYSAWQEKVEAGGFNRQKQSRRQTEEGVFWEPELSFETSYRWHYCQASNRTFLFEQQDLPGDRGDMVKVPCPGCGIETFSVLEDHRLLGSIEGDSGQGVSQGGFPEEFETLMVVHMNTTRSEWMLFPQLTTAQNPDNMTQCSICGRFLDDSPLQPSFENPMDDSPICLQCLTAGRWMLSLK